LDLSSRIGKNNERRKRIRQFIPFLLFIVLILLLSSESMERKPTKVTELSLVWLEDAKALDPVKAEDPQSIELVVNVFDRLLRYGIRKWKGKPSIDPETFLPSLAESFKVESEGTTYTFKLRKDAVFHDGTPVTSKDVKFSLERLSKADPNFGKMVRKIEAVDQFTVRVSLNSPNSLFLHYICSYKASIVKKGFSGGIDSGSGPYKIVEWEKGKKIVLKAIKGHYLNPKFDRVTIRVVEGPRTIEAMLLSGEATGPSRIPLEDLRERAKT